MDVTDCAKQHRLDSPFAEVQHIVCGANSTFARSASFGRSYPTYSPMAAFGHTCRKVCSAHLNAPGLLGARIEPAAD
ncbi:MAG TPA: hypothetical protein VGN43_22775 [Steroidobacteraceae bacterium]|jgi:hypothetical protein|nr:hypothetical protein [Steroidobacteraceae bacterium]